MCKKFLNSFLEYGKVDKKNLNPILGVITPYKKQAHLIKRLLWEDKEVDVQISKKLLQINTVDAF